MKPTDDPNMNCNKSSPIYKNFLKAKENFIPYSYVQNERTIPKKIKVKLVVVNDGRPNYRDTSTDIEKLNALIIFANVMLSKLDSATDPQTNICGNCYISNPRFQLDPQGIVFTNQVEYKGEDSILHIFILPPLGSTQGMAWGGDPKNNFFRDANSFGINLYGSYPGDNLWQNSRALVHEMGHVFSLMHMYANHGNTPESCDESSYDFLSDIFNVGSSKWCPSQNLDYNCIPQDPNTICTNNFMDFRFLQYFSPMQLGIIHRESSLGAIHRFMFPTESPDLHPWNITSSQTWDFPIRLFSDLIVKSGDTLTIKCEVQRPPGSRILVEKNALLIIDGGKITSYHARAEWNGIQLVGDKSKFPIPQYQGSLELKNGATIERAFIAIANYTWDNGAQGGGIIKAKDSRIYNCWRAVALNDYSNFSYHYINQSQCRFDNMEFLIDDTMAYAFHPSAQGFITAFDIRGGVSITNSSFKNLIPFSQREQGQRNQGIYTLSSGFHVANCTFEGMKQGINYAGYAGFPTRPNQIYNNTFENITDNITIAASAFANIRGNSISNMLPYTIQINQMPYLKLGNGIYLDNSQFTNVTCQNTIDGGNINTPYLNTYGTIVNNSSYWQVNVMDNSFTNLTAGTQTQQRNQNLNILCNTFESNDNAFLVNPQSNASYFYLKNQGNGTNELTQYRAGNQFISNQHDIVSYLTNQWSYYYWYAPAFEPNQSPMNNGGNVNIQICLPSTPKVDPNSQCNLIYNCVDLITPLEINDALVSYNKLKRFSLKNSVEGRIQFSNIVQGYNYLSDFTGLETFLIDENDDNGRKLLIGLYLESNEFTQLTQTIEDLSLIDGDEKQAYRDYYNVLIQQKIDGRNADNLNEEEEGIVRTLAASNYEVAPYAKSLLEWTYDEPWFHEIEEQQAMPMSYGVSSNQENKNSELKDVVPNPTNGFATIKTNLTKQDVKANVALVIRDLQGREKLRTSLIKENNTTTIDTKQWGAGIYLYSLEINGKTIATKKLSVQ